RALVRNAIVPLYRFALARPGVRVIFQNAEDRRRLSAFAGLAPAATALIGGSGVVLADYPVEPEPPAPPLVVTFASRLLRPKGVVEFVEAARLLQGRGHAARFVLAGGLDPGNPLSLTEAEL